MNVKIITKSTTGAISKEIEAEINTNVDKVIATVDTHYLMRQGSDVEYVVNEVSQTLGEAFKNNLPLIVLPEWIKLEIIKLEEIKEEQEDVRE